MDSFSPVRAFARLALASGFTCDEAVGRIVALGQHPDIVRPIVEAIYSSIDPDVARRQCVAAISTFADVLSDDVPDDLQDACAHDVIDALGGDDSS